MQGVNKEPRATWERAGAANTGTAAKRNVPQITDLLRCFWESHWMLIRSAFTKQHTITYSIHSLQGQIEISQCFVH